MDARPRPAWLPDTQGFLALGIIVVVGSIAFILLLRPPQLDDRTFGALTTLLGVMLGCMKDVYGFFFGSSKGSKDKDDALAQIATSDMPPAPATATVERPPPKL